ncbi:MAG: WYL domain-containing protein [Gammaproteobacteria bacterium]|nr:WYL domain-containing protein [Gammaproteobacteria bacterium]
MLETSSRLLRLLTLLQTRRSWSGAALAERLDVTERTVRRDVDRLRNLGYVIDAASGTNGGYRLAAGAALPPLLLADDEALAVAIGLRTAAGGGVTGIEEAALRALVKLEQLLPQRLRRRLAGLHTSIVPLGPNGPTVDADRLATIAAACRDRDRLKFRYDDRRQQSSRRRVEPQGLVHASGRWYLVAWDLDRGDWRTFRVDRIGRRIETGPRFASRQGPEGGDLAAYVSRSVSTSAYPVQARVILHAPRDVLAARFSPLAARLTALDGDRCVLETGAPSLHVLAVWLCMLDVGFDVEAPAELYEYLRAVHARLGSVLARR